MRTLLIVILAVGMTAAAAGSQPRVETASSGEHLWIVRTTSERDTADLLHHALEMGGPFAAATVPIHFMPEAIAAFGDRVWVVSPPRALTAGSARSVQALQIRKRPEIDFYFTEPEGRFAILNTLPGEGELAGFTATANGVAALLRVERSRAEQGSVYRLYKLRGERWTRSALPGPPTQLALGEYAMLGVDGPDLDRLNLLTSGRADHLQSLLYRRDAHGWAAEPVSINLDLKRVRSLTHIRGRLAAVVVDEASAVAEIVYLRAGEPLRVAALPLDDAMARGWSVAGMNDGFRMISFADTDGSALVMQDIHWMSGEVGPTLAMARPRLPAGRLLHMTVMLTIAVVTVVLILIVRPAARTSSAGASRRTAEAGVQGDADAIVLPKGVAILSPVSRVFALLIDLVPGGVLALLITRAAPLELLHLPIVTNSLEQAAPYLVMIAIMFVHVTLSEMAKGTSLGKALMGGWVLSTQSVPDAEGLGRPTAKQALIRNALKLLILMVPPLAIFALLSRHLQGFNDIIARTVVVGELPEEDAPSRSDEE